MIERIVLQNMVLVARAEVELDAGMTAITGETGTGKTLLATAIGLALGHDAQGSLVGDAGDHAYAEVTFRVPSDVWSSPGFATFRDLRPDPDDETLTLARKVGRDGRTRAFAWGRSVTKRDLATAGGMLFAAASQHAQRRLVDAACQRNIVDAALGADGPELLAQMRTAWHNQLAADAALLELRSELANAAGSREQIEVEQREFADIAPAADEYDELMRARAMLRNRATFEDAIGSAVRALAGGSIGAVDDELDGPAASAADELGAAHGALTAIAHLDPDIAELADAALALQQQAGDIASQLASRLGELDGATQRLEAIEARLGDYDVLARRYGGTVESALQYWQQLAQRAERLASGEAAIAAAQRACDTARNAAAQCADKLSERRRAAAQQVQRRVSKELADLAMSDSHFVVSLKPQPIGVHGADHVQFLIAPSAHHQLSPIADVASGGELSRIALALQVGSGIHEAPTVLFDEVDAGIGGNTAHAIGAKLLALGEHAQVLCITHLAQVAARARHHIVVERLDGVTTLRRLHGVDEVVSELCRMGGDNPEDPVARERVNALRRRRFDPAALPYFEHRVS